MGWAEDVEEWEDKAALLSVGTVVNTLQVKWGDG